MDIFKQAVERELEIEKRYRELAARAPNMGLQKIFTMLADQEATHAEIFGNLQKAHGGAVEGDLFAAAKEAFAGISIDNDELTVPDPEIALYQKVREFERESRDLYRAAAEKATDPKDRAVLLEMADEEDRHYVLMDNLLEFVSQPKVWLENAEWNQLGAAY